MQRLRSKPAEYLSTAEYAAKYNLSVRQVSKLVELNKIPYIRVGQWIYIHGDTSPIYQYDTSEWLLLKDFADKYEITYALARSLAANKRVKSCKINGRVYISGAERLVKRVYTSKLGDEYFYCEIEKEQMSCSA